MFKPRDPVTIHLVSRDRTRSISIPGIVTSEPQLTTFARRGAQVATTVVEVVSLRDRIDPETGELLGKYLRRSTEQTAFLSRRLTERAPGLDDLSLAALEDKLAESITEFQLRRAGSQGEPEVALA